MQLLLVLGLLIMGLGCAPDEEVFSDVVEVEEADDDLVKALFRSGSIPYRHENKDYSVPWVSCEGQNLRSTFILAAAELPERDSPKKICNGGVAQAFLSSGYAVFLIYLPGYSGAPGAVDYGGNHSKSSLAAVNSYLAKKSKDAIKIKGYWSYGSASVALFFYLKEHPEAQYVVVGGGIYDMEAALGATKDKSMKAGMAKIITRDGEGALESRSIAWDPSGLPKNIVLYHADKDEFSPKEAAMQFRDSLATQGYKVDLSILPEVGHKINSKVHGSALKKLLRDHVGGISVPLGSGAGN